MEAIAVWTFVVGIIIALIVIGTMKMRKAEEKKRWEAELIALGAQEEERKERKAELIALGVHSMDLFESLPNNLGSAEAYLGQAEINFTDRAFVPFWDSIENAATCLAYFDGRIRTINSNLSAYTKLIKQYEDTPPAFPLAPQSVAKLGVGTATAERMKAIVRKAQRDFQFATIYEQRKTNRILVQGFTNLAQALDQMTTQITASIGDLASSVDVMTSTVNESLSAIHSRMSDIHEDLSEEASERAEREKKALEMLDNIQRGRRPFV